MILSLLMTPMDFCLCITAFAVLAWPEADTRLVKVAVERVFISLPLLLFMTIFEYIKWNRCLNKKEGTGNVVPTDIYAVPNFGEKSKPNEYRMLFNQSVLTDID